MDAAPFKYILDFMLAIDVRTASICLMPVFRDTFWSVPLSAVWIIFIVATFVCMTTRVDSSLLNVKYLGRNILVPEKILALACAGRWGRLEYDSVWRLLGAVDHLDDNIQPRRR